MNAKRWATRAAAITALSLGISQDLLATAPYPWPRQRPAGGSLAERIKPPPGYERLPAPGRSFAAWLRSLPLRPAGSPVRLYDGRAKARQDGAFAVVDLDVGSRDLQQCADAVIRLRAEYLLALGCPDRVVFDFTSGHPARWSDWSAGRRPVVTGNRVAWVPRLGRDSSYRSFREFLNSVFTYAGSYSLARQLEAVPSPSTVRPGDVFIQGGFPGHAVLVADVAEDRGGRRVFTLLQSYMPAQDVHVLTNPGDRTGPWYAALAEGRLVTPEWTFSYSDLRRFPDPDCDGGGP